MWIPKVRQDWLHFVWIKLARPMRISKKIFISYGNVWLINMLHDPQNFVGSQEVDWELIVKALQNILKPGSQNKKTSLIKWIDLVWQLECLMVTLCFIHMKLFRTKWGSENKVMIKGDEKLTIGMMQVKLNARYMQMKPKRE